MVDNLFNFLLTIKDLKVISPTSSSIYKDSKLGEKQIANRLHVSTLLEGNVLKAEDRIRISVRLIDGNTERGSGLNLMIEFGVIISQF